VKEILQALVQIPDSPAVNSGRAGRSSPNRGWPVSLSAFRAAPWHRNRRAADTKHP